VSSCFGGGTAAAPRDPNTPTPPAACKSAGEWKQSAYDICTNNKANLVDLQLTQPCGGDLYAGMTYSCCLPGSTTPSAPIDPGPATPPPPSPACTGGIVEDGAPACVGDSALKDRAWKLCAAQGLALTNLGYYGPCADGVSHIGAKYQCCSTPPPPPAPPTPPARTCRKGTDGGPTSCKDYGTWKQSAADTCTSVGLTLTELYPRESCGTDLFRYTDFVCCSN
jgi:hypothetical protein